MYRRDAPIAVDDEGCGQCLDTAVLIAGFIVAEHDPVVDLVLRREGRYRFPAVVIHGDAEHFKPAILVPALKIDEPGYLECTRSAPGSPEIQQTQLSTEVRKGDMF